MAIEIAELDRLLRTHVAGGMVDAVTANAERDAIKAWGMRAIAEIEWLDAKATALEAKLTEQRRGPS